jgi:AcrR family transcriptional regulator
MATNADPPSKRSRPRVALRRDRIVAAAVRLADDRGLSAVTMRALAARLGVEAMSLYNHVAHKGDLLDGMVDHVIEQIERPDAVDDWREAMRRRATSARGVFRSHPWAPALVDSRVTSGPARLRYFDWVLGTLLRAGFTSDGATSAFSLLDSYVYGFGIQQLNFAERATDAPEARAEAILTAIPADTYPYLHRMASQATRTAYDPERDFEFGLEIILDGLARSLDRAPPE